MSEYFESSITDRIAVVTDEVSPDFALALDTAVAHGVTSVEIRGAYGKRAPDFDVREIRFMQKVIADTGVRVVGISPGIGKRGIPGDLRDQVQRSIEFAKAFKADAVTFFGFSGSEESPNDVARSTDVLSDIAALCKEQQINACLENSRSGCVAGQRDATFQLAADSGMRVIWDPANACAAGDSVSVRLKPRELAHVERIHAKGFTPNHAPVDLDSSMLDWRDYIESLETNGFAGFYTIEPHQWSDQPGSFLRSLSCLKLWLNIANGLDRG